MDHATTTGTDHPAHPAPSVATSGLRVELFGVPRVLAGQRSLAVTGETLAEVAASLAAACPALVGAVIDAERGWLLSGYTFVVDERFTSERDAAVTPGASVLLVSSVAGG